MMERLLSKCVAFEYPARNCIGIASRQERRRLVVWGIRDCEAEPLEPETIELAPNCRRGRWLITGLDLDRGDERSFWWESMEGVEEVDLMETPSRPPRVAILNRRMGLECIRELPDMRTEYCRLSNSIPDGRMTVPVG